MSRKLSLLSFGVAIGLVAFVLLDHYSRLRLPLPKRFERQWAADVTELEASGKLPAAWSEVGEIKIIGGTRETRDWLDHVKSPLKPNPQGRHRMEVLVVIWEENGKRGALVQYNIEDGKTGNTLSEIGRTLILSTPVSEKNPFVGLLEDLRK